MVCWIWVFTRWTRFASFYMRYVDTRRGGDTGTPGKPGDVRSAYCMSMHKVMHACHTPAQHPSLHATGPISAVAVALMTRTTAPCVGEVWGFDPFEALPACGVRAGGSQLLLRPFLPAISATAHTHHCSTIRVTNFLALVSRSREFNHRIILWTALRVELTQVSSTIVAFFGHWCTPAKVI